MVIPTGGSGKTVAPSVPVKGGDETTGKGL